MGSWDFFQSLGVIITKQPLTLGGGGGGEKDLGPRRRGELTSPAPKTAIRAILMSSLIMPIYVLKGNQMMNIMIISVSASPSFSPKKLAIALKSN